MRSATGYLANVAKATKAIKSLPRNMQYFGLTAMFRAQVFALCGDDRGLICLDGGATVHITNDARKCFNKGPSAMKVMGVLGTPSPCSGYGNLHLQPRDDLPTVILTGAHIADDFPYSFISESMLTTKGCVIIKQLKTAVVLDTEGRTLFRASLRPPGLFFVDGEFLRPISDSDVMGISKSETGGPQVDNPEQINLARSYATKAQDDLLMLAHRKYSHMEMSRCAKAVGITLPPGYTFPICDSCVLGKSENHPHHKGANLKPQRRCQALHFDFCGPFPTTGIYGERYILIFIDGYTGYIWDFYPKTQTEFFAILDALLLRLDNEFGKNCVSILRSDNAKVFKEAPVQVLCEARGIAQQFSAPYSQWQNGKAERAFGTLLNLMRPALFQSGLGRSYWVYAARLAVIAVNRTPVDEADNIAKNFPPSYSKLERLHQMEIPTQMNGVYALGTLAYKHISGDLRDKLDMKSKACLYLGVDPKIKGAIMLPMDGGSISTTAVFTVNQLSFPLRLSTTVQATAEFKRDNGSDFVASPKIFWPPHETSLAHLRDPRMDEPSPLPTSSRTLREWQPSQQALENIANSAEHAWQTLAGKTLMFSPTAPHHVMDDEELAILDFRTGSDLAFIYSVKKNAKVLAQPLSRTQYQAATPSTYLKSKASPHAKFWSLGRKREVISNLKLETMGPLLVNPPPGYTPIPTSFVYKNKYVGDEELLPELLPDKSWKARVIVKGYMMIEGRDYCETFAPTAAPTSIRLIAAIAARHGLPLKSADFETAFLNSPMDTTVYVTTPAGFEQWAKYGLKGLQDLPKDFVPGDEPEPVGCRLLLKGIPGIKQGSRLFYKDQQAFWLSYGFLQLPADPCVFYRIDSTGLTLVGVWVDDLIAAVPNDDVWQAMVTEIRKKFPLADKGNASLFLGIEIKQSKDFHTVTLSQRNSIEDLLERANMRTCNPAPTPCVAGFVWTKQDCPEVPQSVHLDMPNYRGLVALALFISVWTRGDVAYTVNKLCKFMSNPGDKHVAALKRLLRYFAGTKDHGLVYTGVMKATLHSPLGLHGATDSSHMDCIDTSRSTIAFIFFFDTNAISWYSKLHGYVTTCSNHSEYAALFVGSKEAFYLIGWLQPLQSFLNLQLEPTPIFLDNDGAKSLSQDPVGRFKNKHVRMAHHFTQELVTAGVIKTMQISTLENCSDILTKALGPNVFPLHAIRLAGDTVRAHAA
jgi:histone deacetylase 1/2